MREIKFRIYDKELKESHIEELQDVCEDDYWYDGETDVWSVLYDSTHEKNRFVALQYTGLKDWDEKEVYEGDIVQYLYEGCDENDQYIVEWDEEDLRYSFRSTLKNEYIALEDMYDCDYGKYSIRIIGNIYDNPELIK